MIIAQITINNAISPDKTIRLNTKSVIAQSITYPPISTMNKMNNKGGNPQYYFSLKLIL